MRKEKMHSCLKVFSGLQVYAVLLFLLIADLAGAQTAMISPWSRNRHSLNGQWKVIIDPSNTGEWLQVWLEKRPEKKTDFFEYSFENGPVLNVPGDFNSQRCDLAYYEGVIWYKKEFEYTSKDRKRLFLYFGGVNYQADVYLNGRKLGSHEGGFTPFQFEITGVVKDGTNAIVVKTNNARQKNGLPANGFDWLNYGGITRDVDLVETGETYIDDFTLRLKKGSLKTVQCMVKLNGNQAARNNITIKIPELNIKKKIVSDSTGYASVEFSGPFRLWSPDQPKLYEVIIECGTDSITDSIGFRSIEVKDGKVWLNKQPVFLKGVNIHEENPYKGARAASLEDARLLLGAAKELGCNFVRLAHYPHNDNMIRETEKMGIMVWDELPIYQHINFSDSTVQAKMELMLSEMVKRDKNRCGVIIWSLSNETYPSTANRSSALIKLTESCRQKDPTRLVAHVTNTQRYANNIMEVSDTLYRYADIVAVNEYIGWYVPWQGKPSDTKWKVKFGDKPVVISEFGGEALYGSRNEPTDMAAYWTENYQEKIYADQLAMFDSIPHLAGVCPWLLFDYKSPGRLHPVYQKGYNRKGLLSEKGEKKKAWKVMREYYQRK